MTDIAFTYYVHSERVGLKSSAMGRGRLVAAFAGTRIGQ